MSDSGDDRADRLARYLALVHSHPHWFDTPADGIQIVTDAEGIAVIEAEMGARYEARGQPPSWAEAGIHYQDPYLVVLRDAVRFPDGSPGIHHRTMRLEGEPSGVAVLPRMGDRLVLLRHYRHPTRAWSWEIPRGAVEPKTNVHQTIAAELREEMEAEASDIVDLGPIFGASGFMGLEVRLFTARLNSYGRPRLSEGISEIREFSVSEFEDTIMAGEITDSFTLAAFLHARLRGIV